MKKRILIVIAILIIFFLFLFFFRFSYKIFLGKGDSMQPTFDNCTLLLIDYKINPSLIKEGEIILIDISEIDVPYIAFDKIAHRVVKNDIVNKKISTKGDNYLIYRFPTQIDGEFDYNKILGKIISYFDVPNFVCEYNKQQKELSIVSIGGSCSRLWVSSSGSNYYLRCYVSYNGGHCTNPLVVASKDDTPYFNSISNWVLHYGGETCNITESHDTFIKLECQVPGEYCSTGFGVVNTKIDLSGTLDYNACYTFKEYVPIGGIKCGGFVYSTKGYYWYTSIVQCSGKDTYTTLQTCGSNQVCLNNECITAECYGSTDCVDTCSMSYVCSDYKCIGTPKTIPLKPCNQATWTESNCSWDSSDCIPEPPIPTPKSFQEIINSIIEWVKDILSKIFS